MDAEIKYVDHKTISCNNASLEEVDGKFSALYLDGIWVTSSVDALEALLSVINIYYFSKGEL